MLLICEEFSKILIADAGCPKKLFFETIMMQSHVTGLESTWRVEWKIVNNIFLLTYHEALWKLFNCFTLVLLVLDFSEISESEIFFLGKKGIKVKDLVVRNKKCFLWAQVEFILFMSDQQEQSISPFAKIRTIRLPPSILKEQYFPNIW